MLLGSTAISIYLDFKEEIWPCLEIEYLPCLQVTWHFLLPIKGDAASPPDKAAQWGCFPGVAQTRVARTRTAPTDKYAQSYSQWDPDSHRVLREHVSHICIPFLSWASGPIPPLSPAGRGCSSRGLHPCTQQHPPRGSPEHPPSPTSPGSRGISTPWCITCCSEYMEALWDWNSHFSQSLGTPGAFQEPRLPTTSQVSLMWPETQISSSVVHTPKGMDPTRVTKPFLPSFPASRNRAKHSAQAPSLGTPKTWWTIKIIHLPCSTGHGASKN